MKRCTMMVFEFSFRLLLAVVVLATLPFAFGAKLEVRDPAFNYDQAVWRSQLQYRIYKEQDFETAAMIKAASIALRNHPDLDPAGLAKSLQSRRDEMKAERSRTPERLSDSDLYNALLDSFSLIPQVGGAIKTVGGHLGRAADQVADSVYGPQYRLSSQIQAERQREEAFAALPISLDDWTSQVKSDPRSKAAAIHDLLIAPQTHVPSDADADAVAMNDPEFAEHVAISALTAEVRAGRASVEQLDKRITAGMGEMSRVLRQSGAAIEEFTRSQKSAAIELEREREQLAAAQAGIFIASSLIGITDPASAKALKAVGNAYFQAGAVVQRYQQSLLRPGTGGMSGLVLTGDLLGVTLNLFSALSNGPTPEQMILQEIGNLRRDLGELGRHLDSRFDQVDQELRQVYSAMVDGFEKIERSIVAGTGEVIKAQYALVGLQHQLSRLERNTHTYLRAGFDQRQLVSDLSRCFFSDQTLETQWMRIEKVNDCFNAFRRHAVVNSRDMLSIPSSEERTDSFTMERVLSQFSLDENFPWLARVAANPSFGNPALNAWLTTTDAPANPLSWAMGASAFLRLSREHPSFLKVFNPQAVQALIGSGERLAEFTHLLTSTHARLSVSPNHVFWQSLFAEHDAHAERVADLIRLTREELIRERFHGVDPWKDANQDSALTLPLEIHNGSFDNTVLGCVPEFYRFLPNDLRNAFALGIGKVEASASLIAPCSGDYNYLNGTWSGQCRRGALLNLNYYTDGLIYYVRRKSLDAESTPKGNSVGFQATAENWQQGYDIRKRLLESSLDTGQLDPASVEQMKKDSHFNQRLQSALSVARIAVRDEILRRITDAGCIETPPIRQAGVKGCELRSEILQMSGLSRLITALVQLGFGQSIESDERLRGAFFGRERLFDSTSLHEAIAADANGDLLGKLDETLLERSRNARGIVSDLLKSGKIGEPQPLVHGVLRELKGLQEDLDRNRPPVSAQQAYAQLLEKIGTLR